MGSGISMSDREFDKQEAYVRQNFEKAKQSVPSRYTSTQIRMKLRQEYYKKPSSNDYISDYDWQKFKN